MTQEHQRLLDFAIYKCGSLKDFAKTLNKTSSYFSQYFKKGNSFGSDLLKEIADKHNININWLLTGRGNMLVDSKDNVEIVDSTMQPVPYLTLEAISKMQADLVLIKEKIGVYEKSE